MAHPKIQELLTAAEQDISRLRGAATSADARSAWISFLENANRALNRLEGYSRSTGQTQKYKDLLTREIWTNKLTKYMRTARNAHEHGVEEITMEDPFNSRLVLPTGFVLGTPLAWSMGKNGRVVVHPTVAPAGPMSGNIAARRIELRFGIRMIPIVSFKGEIVMPPGSLLFEADDEPEALAAARIYLKWVVEQIETFA